MGNFRLRMMPVPIKKRAEEKIYAAENRTTWRGWTTADGRHKGNTQFQKDDAVFCGYDAPFWPGAFALRETRGEGGTICWAQRGCLSGEKAIKRGFCRMVGESFASLRFFVILSLTEYRPVCKSEGRDPVPSARRKQMRFGDSVSEEIWL